ncbi:uncharacterized protein [Hemitrygon akajei]|uniref:uncharacterized protein n=1 Tax=Hemitrygon akajei TaxID=2704970 RepID=UPI003BF96AC0
MKDWSRPEGAGKLLSVTDAPVRNKPNRKRNRDPDGVQNEMVTTITHSSAQTNQQSSSIISSGISFSQHSMRFELPVDLWLLKDMSPTQYLSTYCRCDDDLSMLYKAVFSQKDKDKDGLVNLKEMEHALLLVYKLNERHIERLYTLTKVNEDFKVDLKLFIALGCLMSRILDKEPIDDAVKPNIIAMKDLLEKADFYALKWRASDVEIGGDLWILLSYLF